VPSVNAVAETYRLGEEVPELGTALGLSGVRCNRFLHVTESAADVVLQSKMQRTLGQRTGTCFQRCVGMDAINSCFSITYDIDAKHGTRYHQQFRDFIGMMQRQNYVLGGAMTDPKGDRSKGPTGQSDPDLFVRVVERRVDGLVIRGAKMHQTGCINAHWLLTMPGGRMASGDEDYASICALPVDSPGLSFIYGRQSCDTRAIEVDGECSVAWPGLLLVSLPPWQQRLVGGWRSLVLPAWGAVIWLHVHGAALWSACRHRHRPGQREVRRPGSHDHLRRRLRAVRARLHERRGRVRAGARRALHLLPPVRTHARRGRVS
jgi:hypothetical protein